MALDKGLIDPAQAIIPPAAARPGSVSLRISGQSFTPDITAMKHYSSGLVLLQVPHAFSVWPGSLIRRAQQPEDVLIGSAGSDNWVFLSAAYLQQDAGPRWQIVRGIPPAWRGAPVISVKDGALLGFVLSGNDRAEIGLIDNLTEDIEETSRFDAFALKQAGGDVPIFLHNPVQYG